MPTDACQINIMCQNGNNHNAPLSDGLLSLAMIFGSNRDVNESQKWKIMTILLRAQRLPPKWKATEH